ncbi:MAG: hypothetical protein ABS75_06735 [Pelagibacterium sp. SCN 63-23]|nr:MAG: hypothetical protein ABS75_06735 [Pelagibacterium sp. SCN 63-23]
MSGGQRRFPWLGHGIVLLLILLISLSPVIALAVLNARQAGAPMQLTDLMASWGVLGWLVTVPFTLGGFLFVLWMLVIPLHYLAWRRSRMRTGS